MFAAFLAHFDQPRDHLIHIEDVAFWTFIPFIIVLVAVALWATMWIIRSPDRSDTRGS